MTMTPDSVSLKERGDADHGCFRPDLHDYRVLRRAEPGLDRGAVHCLYYIFLGHHLFLLGPGPIHRGG